MINRILIWLLKRNVPDKDILRKHFLISLLNRIGFATFEHPHGDNMLGVRISKEAIS